MDEIIFLVEESLDGGFSARALNNSIYTDADSMDELKDNIKDAIQCHFDSNQLPKIIRLHFVHDEVYALS